MSDSPKIQIPALPTTNTVNDSDYLHIRQGNRDYKVDVGVVKDYVLDNLPISSTSTLGLSEFATPAEHIAGTSLTLTTNPAGVKSMIDATKITETVTSITDAQFVLVQQSNINKRITLANLKTLFLNAIASATESVKGLVQLATVSELTGKTKATHPDGVRAIVTSMWNTTLRQQAYPIGSIYINAAVNTNPSTLLGYGTWVAFGSGRVLVGVDTSDSNFNTLGKTGGVKDSVVVSHTHTMSNAGDHSHALTLTGYYYGSADRPRISSNDTGGSAVTITQGNNSISANGNHTHTVNSTGVSGLNKNLQPYVTVYMWRRTA